MRSTCGRREVGEEGGEAGDRYRLARGSICTLSRCRKIKTWTWLGASRDGGGVVTSRVTYRAGAVARHGYAFIVISNSENITHHQFLAWSIVKFQTPYKKGDGGIRRNVSKKRKGPARLAAGSVFGFRREKPICLALVSGPRGICMPVVDRRCRHAFRCNSICNQRPIS